MKQTEEEKESVLRTETLNPPSEKKARSSAVLSKVGDVLIHKQAGTTAEVLAIKNGRWCLLHHWSGFKRWSTAKTIHLQWRKPKVRQNP